MVVFPNAKINLGLSIGDKRSDGYHNLSSVFYPVPICDVLEIVPNNKAHHRLFCSGLDIPVGGGDNLCLRAAAAMRAKFGTSNFDIHLHKVIPLGAGLGGGSSDASFIIKAINTFEGLGLSDEVLEALALEMGSDCPFFIANRPAAVEGRGEVLHPMDFSLSGYYLLLAMPGIHISTARAFAELSEHRKVTNPAAIVRTTKPEDWNGKLINDFESYALKEHPQLKEIREALYNSGAIYASLTGSGSAFYGIYAETPGAEVIGAIPCPAVCLEL